MATSDSHPEFGVYVPNVTLAVARLAGGGSPVSGFSAEAGFSLSDNGDGTLSITDSQSRFGAKPNGAKPVWFFDFGSGSDQPHPTLSRQQKTILWSSNCRPTQVVAKPGSTHSMTIDCESASGDISVFAGTTADLRGDKTLQLPANSGRKHFRYYDVYNDFTATELQESAAANSGGSFPNFKTHRWQSPNAQATPYTGTVLQAYTYKFGWFTDGYLGADFYDTRDQLPTKSWNAEEEYHQISSATGATDATVMGTINGARKFLLENRDSHGGFDPNDPANRWSHYKLGNYSRWALPGVAPWRANILYVDDSWCRVYVTDKPTWSDAEVKSIEIQVPVGWTASQIDFNKRVGGLGNLSGKYLWAVDNNDTKILVGSWS